MLLGGLTAADTSTDAVSVVSGATERDAGRLPTAVHDAAAARLGGAVYLFGGGDGTRQHGEIVRIGGGVVGSLPAPSSDQAAATIGDTAYVVGGFTGTRWLDTIVAWSPGRGARVVAHLPSPVRYAAVASAGGKLVIAGGSLAERDGERARSSSTRLTGRVAAPCRSTAGSDDPRCSARELGGDRLRDRRTRGGARHADRTRSSRSTHEPRRVHPAGRCANRCPTPRRSRSGRRSLWPAAGAPAGTQCLAPDSLARHGCEAAAHRLDSERLRGGRRRTCSARGRGSPSRACTSRTATATRST